MTDVSRKFSETVGLLGVSPGFIDAIEKPLKNPIYYNTELTKQSYDGLQGSTLYEMIFDEGGLTFGE